MPGGGGPVPAAVASQIAHAYGKDVVLILALDRGREESHDTAYGKTDADKAAAKGLAELIRRLLDEELERRAAR